MVTSHTALSAAEDERCSCAETTTVVGELSSGFYSVMGEAGGDRNHNKHNICISSVNVKLWEHLLYREALFDMCVLWSAVWRYLYRVQYCQVCIEHAAQIFYEFAVRSWKEMTSQLAIREHPSST